MNVHFSSNTCEWSTPQVFFDKVAAEFGPFDLDPCCTIESAKAARFFTIKEDGLSQPWKGKKTQRPLPMCLSGISPKP